MIAGTSEAVPTVSVFGDRFIPSDCYVEALVERLPRDSAEIRTAEWSATKAEQHEVQQIMEVRGADAVCPPPELLHATAGADVLCLHYAPVNRAVLDAAPSLRLVAVARAGLENIDLALATARGIGVVPAPGRNAAGVAELQLGLMLAEARDIARADASVKLGAWRKDFPGRKLEISGQTIGVVGFGHVGRSFARRLRGFDCRILAYDPYAADADLAAHHVQRAGALEDIFSEGDFVVIQARHTPETDRLITAKHFALMKPHAYFINAARSRVVDCHALYAALASGRIAGAGLDVFDEEPLPAGSHWRQLDNVTITTHFGSDTEGTNRVSAALVSSAVEEYLRDGKVTGAVNAGELNWNHR